MLYKLFVILKVECTEYYQSQSWFSSNVQTKKRPIQTFFSAERLIELNHSPKVGDKLRGYGFGQMIDILEISDYIIEKDSDIPVLNCYNSRLKLLNSTKFEAKLHIKECGWKIVKEIPDYFKL